MGNPGASTADKAKKNPDKRGGKVQVFEKEVVKVQGTQVKIYKDFPSNSGGGNQIPRRPRRNGLKPPSRKWTPWGTKLSNLGGAPTKKTSLAKRRIHSGGGEQEGCAIGYVQGV